MKHSELKQLIREELKTILSESTDGGYETNPQTVKANFKTKNTPGHYLVKDLTNKKNYDPMVDPTEWIAFGPGKVKSIHVGRMKKYVSNNPSDGAFTYYVVTIVQKPGENEYYTTKY